MTIPMAPSSRSAAGTAGAPVATAARSSTTVRIAGPHTGPQTDGNAGDGRSPFVPGALAGGGQRRKRGRPRDPEADGRILRAASDLLLAHGFDNMTVDDVASRARVGKATVYRRWATKEDLALAAMRRLYDARMPIPHTGSLRGDLREAFTSALMFANSEVGGAYLRTGISESTRDPRIAALYQQANEQVRAAARQMFERGILRGEVRADAHIDGALELLHGILLVRVISSHAMPAVTEADSLVDLVLRGIGS